MMLISESSPHSSYIPTAVSAPNTSAITVTSGSLRKLNLYRGGVYSALILPLIETEDVFIF
jgi:hypothetical protein